MSKIAYVAVVAAVAAVLAGPAFAGDNIEALLHDSGGYSTEGGLAGWNGYAAPTRSAVKAQLPSAAYDSQIE